jgi:transcription antitermination factor NusG
MTEMKAFDPTAWYVAETKRNMELTCLSILNDLSGKTVDYPVEAYVASQQELKFYANRTRRVKENIIIRGKIFIRVDEQHRQDLLKHCLFLTRYVKDPSLTPTASGFTAFARVPDREIRVLREILQMADGPVEYFDHLPKSGDKIQVLSGQFSGLKGKVEELSGRDYVLVILDQLGSFRFRLPVTAVGKVK